MASEEDEIQLVNRAGGEDSEDDAVMFEVREDGTSCMKMDSGEESEPRVADERHIKHPGKLRMRLRVGV